MGATEICVGAIQDQLESTAGQVAQVMEEQLQVGAGPRSQKI